LDPAAWRAYWDAEKAKAPTTDVFDVRACWERVQQRSRLVRRNPWQLDLNRPLAFI
jgi:hypothetical protein